MSVTEIGNGSHSYDLLPATTMAESQPLKFAIIYGNGTIQYHNYGDLHPYMFSPDGKKLFMTIAYSPSIIFTGRNLLQLERNLSQNTLASLTVYRQGYHAPITKNDAPVITGAYYAVRDKDTGQYSVSEALPVIADVGV